MHCLLIHGQGRTPYSMRWLGLRLRRRGYSVQYFGYAVQSETFEQICARLVVTLAEFAQPYAIVAHSLGGILARAALPQLATPLPIHLVMLGPPNHSPVLARLLKDNPVYLRVTGDCGQQLASPAFYQRLPKPLVPTTIIAGTEGPRGRWSPFGLTINDGVVSVAETSLGAAFPVLLVPSIHTFLMNSPRVLEIVDGILHEADA